MPRSSPPPSSNWSSDLPSTAGVPLLVIETSSNHCLVAASYRGEIFEDTRYLERVHNQHILQMLEGVHGRLQEKFGGSGEHFGLIAFGQGPGSFTGVRIAAAVTQAVAFAHDAKVIALSSACINAQSWADSATGSVADTAEVVVLIRSRAAAYYAQRCSQVDSIVAPLGEPVLLESYAQYQQWLGTQQTVLIGELPPWLSESGTSATVLPIGSLHGSSAITQALANQAELLDPALALPKYLSADSPWQPSQPHS